MDHYLVVEYATSQQQPTLVEEDVGGRVDSIVALGELDAVVDFVGDVPYDFGGDIVAFAVVVAVVYNVAACL